MLTEGNKRKKSISWGREMRKNDYRQTHLWKVPPDCSQPSLSQLQKTVFVNISTSWFWPHNSICLFSRALWWKLRCMEILSSSLTAKTLKCSNIVRVNFLKPVFNFRKWPGDGSSTHQIYLRGWNYSILNSKQIWNIHELEIWNRKSYRLS